LAIWDRTQNLLRIRGVQPETPHSARSRMDSGLEKRRSLEFGSAVLAENGLTWIISPTGSASIPVGCRSRNGEGLALSGVEVELVTSTTSEP